jgi:hypothetical protein
MGHFSPEFLTFAFIKDLSSSCANQFFREHLVLPLDSSISRVYSFLEQMYPLMIATRLADNLTHIRLFTRDCQMVNDLHTFGITKDDGNESNFDSHFQEGIIGEAEPDEKQAGLEQFQEVIVGIQGTIGVG